MALLRIKDGDGNVREIFALKGDKGDKGDKGNKGDPGEVIHTDAEQTVLEDVFVKIPSTYQANPDTLLEVIGKAEAGATIQLLTGEYPLLTLTGINAYPEGLTIVGGDGVSMAGISITSGIKDQEIATPYPGNAKYHCDNVDVSNAIMPRGLTVKNLAFTDSFSLRNCGLDTLSIIGCTFAEGADIRIEPNTMYDCYGGDYTNPSAHAFDTRRSYAKVMAKNVVIRECTFTNANDTARLGSTGCAIRVVGVDGITIYKNTIKAASLNGVNVCGVSGEELGIYSTGKIAITNNTISNTGDRSIRLFNLVDADVFVMANTLNTADVEDADGYIAASRCTNTTFNWGSKSSGNKFRFNKYNGNTITLDSGIAVSGCKNPLEDHIADTNNPHSVTAEQVLYLPEVIREGIIEWHENVQYVMHTESSGSWNCRLWSDNFAELYAADLQGADITGEGYCELAYELPYPMSAASAVQVTAFGKVFLVDCEFVSSTELRLVFEGDAGAKVFGVNLHIAGYMNE